MNSMNQLINSLFNTAADAKPSQAPAKKSERLHSHLQRGATSYKVYAPDDPTHAEKSKFPFRTLSGAAGGTSYSKRGHGLRACCWGHLGVLHTQSSALRNAENLVSAALLTCWRYLSKLLHFLGRKDIVDLA